MSNYVQVRLPTTINEGESPARFIRERVDLAIDQGLSPITRPGREGEQFKNWWVPLSLVARIESESRRLELSKGELVTGWVLAGEQAMSGAPEVLEVPSADEQAGFRPAQRELLSVIRPALRAGRIVMAEASTGTGKTRVASAAAHQLIDEGADRVVIAAPSIRVMAQHLHEWALYADQVDSDLPTITARLGRGQFVSRGRLEALLETDDLSEQAHRRLCSWLKDEGEPRLSRGHHIGAGDADLSWLMEDALALAPELDPDLICLEEGTPSDDPGAVAYAGQRQSDARIIIASHHLLVGSLLAQQFTGRGLLPEFQSVIVDEGHLLPEIAKQMLTNDVSPQGIRQVMGESRPDLKKAGVLRAADELSALCLDIQNTLRRPRGRRKFMPVSASEDDDLRKVRRWARKARGPLKKITSSLSGSRASYFSRIDAGLRVLTSRTSKARVGLSWSGKRGYIRVNVGQQNPSRLLRRLWDEVDSGLLLSATLLTRGATGYSGVFMQHQLGVPGERLETPPPVSMPWLYTQPIVHIPSKRKADSLIPVSAGLDSGDQSNADVDAYSVACARRLGRISGSAVGGTLVLCTSYDAIERLGAILPASLQSRLILQRRFDGATICADQFLEMARTGERPVWLATGAAWNGLDIRAPGSASEDFLLTDLAIPRIPFPNFSEQKGKASAMQRSAFDLRQGLGRLVRRNGVSDRHIWILDGRLKYLNDYPFLRGAASVLSEYPNTEEF